MIEKLKIKFQHPLFRNSFFGSSGFIFISLIGLIVTPLIVAKFGIEQYGIYILITSVLGYYGIFDFGLGQGMIKFVSEYNSKGLDKELNDAVNSVFFVQAIIGLFLTLLINLFAVQIIDVLKISRNFYSDALIALKTASFSFFFSFLAATFSSALKGLELYGSTAIVDSISNLALNVLLLIILYLNYGIKEAVIVNLLISILQLILYFFLFKFRKRSYLFRIKFNIKIIKKFISFTFYVFLSRISNIFSTYVIRFVISFFLGPSAVTYYVVPGKLIGAFGGVLSSAANAIFPYTSRLVATGKTKELKESFIKANMIFTAISLPISIFIILFSKPILTLWMGSEFAEKSWIILSIITLSGTIGSFSAIPNLVLLGLGNSKLIGVFSAITITSYIIFMPLLTKNFGLIGASNALLITSITVVGFVLIMTTKSIGIKFNYFFKRIYSIHFLPMILFIAGFTAYKFFIDTSYLFELSFGMTLVFVYYIYLQRKKMLIL